MGYTNAVSLKRLITEVNKGGYDAVIHVGGKPWGVKELKRGRGARLNLHARTSSFKPVLSQTLQLESHTSNYLSPPL